MASQIINVPDESAQQQLQCDLMHLLQEQMNAMMAESLQIFKR
jgi:hypothetical protein